MKKNLVWKILCIVLALTTIGASVGWGWSMRKQTCLGMKEAIVAHCEAESGKCYLYVRTADGITDKVRVSEGQYPFYAEGDTVLVDVMANYKGEKSLLFSDENP